MGKAGLAAGALAVLGVWGRLVYLQPKARYNQLHPYTSWIPITAFIVLRNLTPGMRLSALALYGWLGKVSCAACAWACGVGIAWGCDHVSALLAPDSPPMLG